MLQRIGNELGQAFESLKKFIRHPQDNNNYHLPARNKFRHLLALFVLEVPIMVFFIFFLIIIDELTGVDLGEHSLQKMIEENPGMVLFAGVILAPLIEEFMFRCFITFRQAFYVLWPMFLYAKLAKKNRWATLRHLREAWQWVFPWIFYLSAISFGLVHSLNFENFEQYIWLAALLTLPQMVIGIFLGYLRVKFGLIWSMIFHAIHNAAFLTPVLLFGV